LIGCWRPVRTDIKVRGPSRPTNIATIIINRPATDNSGVVPVVKPTVPRAENVSKRRLTNLLVMFIR
jgi:hypothetical protein